MKIGFISQWGLGLTLAMQMQEYGHNVKFFIDDKNSQDVGDGFIKKAENWKQLMEWCDYVIADDTHLTKLTDPFREKGIPVIGGTKMTDMMEDDRGAGQKMFKAAGLDILESQEFKSIEEAISYVQDNPGPYVVKVSGKAQNDKTSTYVGQMDDGSDILSVLEHMSEKMDEGVSAVEVQEKVDGLEVAIGGIFNGEKFVGPCEIDWEHKKLMSWDTQQGMGPNTGEMGTVSVWSGQDVPLFKKIVLPMVRPLKAMGFHGFFNINCIVSDGKIYPLEETNRFGWPTLPMQVETMKENDLGQLFFDAASGKDCDFEVTHPWSVCVVIGVPPLPYMNDEIFEKYSKDMPVLFKEGMAPEGLYPGEAKQDEDGWKVAGTSGCLAVAAAGGHSIKECQKAAYAIAEKVIAPSKMVRDDIGRTTSDAYEELQDMGLIRSKEEVEA